MSAFNLVEIRSTCPACGAFAAIECQAHVAALYDGPYSAIFDLGRHVIGQPFLVQPLNIVNIGSWLESVKGKSARECCYAECDVCHAELFAVIEFDEFTPARVVQVGLEVDWPAEYER
ncbi:MAG TPA: hypothetical protein VHC20_00010 [Candidatus Paceibacterota bacterium]|nr:hypothetical protein [Candidatus Paceibacterota bacterium]